MQKVKRYSKTQNFMRMQIVLMGNSQIEQDIRAPQNRESNDVGTSYTIRKH